MRQCQTVAVQNNIRILMSATSYPRSANDWQGLFIKKLVDALVERQFNIKLWAPNGPRPSGAEYICDESDQLWLEHLTSNGGIAHLLRNKPFNGIASGISLLRRLRKNYIKYQGSTDIFHINWLQNALPIYGTRKPAVISVLGTDFKLLKLPGMTNALRALCKSSKIIMAPNADWMAEELHHRFGDVATIAVVPFGIDSQWYDVPRSMDATNLNWLAVTRVTKEKIGRLFEWGESLFSQNITLHLFGPNQDGTHIPSWVNYHGPVTAGELAKSWFPKATGLITLSQHSEGRPQIILEAMAAGLPIIASDIPGHRDIISDQEHGYLVSSKEGLISAIDNLRDPTVLERISTNNKIFCREHFGTWSDCVSRYERLYKRLLI